MAFGHGSKGVFKITDSGAALRDISSFVTNVQFPHEADVAEVSVLGNVAKQFVVGLKNGTFSVDGNYDVTVDGYLIGILGLAGSPGQAFEYDPAGTGTGMPKYTGNAILTAYNISTSVSDAQKWTATFQITGDVTRGLN